METIDKKTISDAMQSALKFLTLENTRLIYDGIEELCKGTINSIWNKNALDERYDALSKTFGGHDFGNEIKSQLVEAFGENGELLCHNALNNFIKFFGTNNDTKGKNVITIDSIDANLLTNMAKLFLLMYLLNENPKQKFYIYENLCTAMADILGYDNCYIIKSDNCKIRIVQQCATLIDDNTRIFERALRTSNTKIIDIVNSFCGDLAVQKIENTGNSEPFILDSFVFKAEHLSKEDDDELKDGKEKDPNFLICCIKIDYSRGEESENENSFYFVLNKFETQAKNYRLYMCSEYKKIRNSLFLRHDFSVNLSRDFYELMNFKDDFSQVNFISNSRKMENSPNILHVTDFHASRKEGKRPAWDPSFLAQGEDIAESKAARQDFWDEQRKNGVDLIVISGDLIAAGSTAKEAEDNYVEAAECIFDLAKEMWGDASSGKSRLRADWKKRILIVPGNHDYSAMNDLESYMEDRQTKAKGVARQSGSSMAKHAYFIDFIRKRLDISLEFIDDKMNYLRVYDEMKSMFICLNSNAAISPMRSNKVTLDYKINESFIHVLEKDKNKQYAKYILLHHSPRYVYFDMNYFADKYPPKIEQAETNDRYYQEWDSYVKSVNKIAKNIIDGQKIANDTIAGQKNGGSDIKNESFYTVCEEYKEYFKEEIGRVSHIRDAMSHDYKETILDKLDYLKRFCKLIDAIKSNPDGSKILVYAGHIHCERTKDPTNYLKTDSSYCMTVSYIDEDEKTRLDGYYKKIKKLCEIKEQACFLLLKKDKG